MLFFFLFFFSLILLFLWNFSIFWGVFIFLIYQQYRDSSSTTHKVHDLVLASSKVSPSGQKTPDIISDIKRDHSNLKRSFRVHALQ
ncbi:hypothetical protein GLOIN_2v1670998 [Rhizophagus irregularis DAOM 181602=DAOM 197198]|uniref:Uncharacterized protein n=1 Tax=Rhizophagus irregularis (strain DAOM 181602 / DAOM 197198 / MUCL 43194) TaxID=747089 RepID=A0A2P4PHP6_RHIID|nr:hypothetical protein GLOIN_2v1670998 [Rhizophagus irregularis DAOM 181602=DAOM 197198]POG64912.1 hypothetical protein GLOIN_2v1670998 [Rhizophagus irregularis DAOM 181602=DAOM 197198]|eukprot:XP_025171778.1 hypothetical protein GLOIN_2v1670998 [Rhizophagus irregularis DAOM 181602=DAOM 197198]